MEPQTFIFIGRSGSGKGTQAKLLIEWLNKRTAEPRPLFYLETGDKFRQFIAASGYSSELAKKIMDQSKLQPAFLAVWMWSHLLVENLAGGEHLILDGTPRTLPEARILDSAMKFYGRAKPYVVQLDVSRAWATDRLTERGRGDDQKVKDITTRMNWFEEDTRPAIAWYENNSDYRYLKINGEQTIADVHTDIIKHL